MASKLLLQSRLGAEPLPDTLAKQSPGGIKCQMRMSSP
jgi:hypothetical protein